MCPETPPSLASDLGAAWGICMQSSAWVVELRSHRHPGLNTKAPLAPQPGHLTHCLLPPAVTQWPQDRVLPDILTDMSHHEFCSADAPRDPKDKEMGTGESLHGVQDRAIPGDPRTPSPAQSLPSKQESQRPAPQNLVAAAGAASPEGRMRLGIRVQHPILESLSEISVGDHAP